MTRSLLFAAAATLSLTLGACAANEAATEAAASGDMTPTARDAYVGMAAASDMFEIQSSQLARTRAQSPAVRDFAQMMIDHHTQTTAQLTAAARSAGVTPPMPALLPMQARMMSDLQAASAADFDRVYTGQQVQAHEMALALHGNYARNGDTAALRTVANATTPIIQQHLDRARQLAGQ
jgi:putative membrane protein